MAPYLAWSASPSLERPSTPEAPALEHETYPIFHNPDILRVIENVVRWAAFVGSAEIDLAVANVPPARADHVERVTSETRHTVSLMLDFPCE